MELKEEMVTTANQPRILFKNACYKGDEYNKDKELWEVAQKGIQGFNK